jgi:hypothetical protein
LSSRLLVFSSVYIEFFALLLEYTEYAPLTVPPRKLVWPCAP